jgi:peptidoglycan hydrolase CwlO-like protein
MRKPTGLQKIALAVVNWIGSPESVIVHTIIFVIAFASVLFNFLPFVTLLLILNTVISLEAIYLALFNQLAINYANEGIDAVGKDIDELQEDVEEIQEDVGEISEDVDELQEDVEEMSEDEVEEQRIHAEHNKTLADIQNDLRKLMGDIERLKKE